MVILIVLSSCFNRMAHGMSKVEDCTNSFCFFFITCNNLCFDPTAFQNNLRQNSFIQRMQFIDIGNYIIKKFSIFDNAIFDRLCKTEAVLPKHRQQLEALRDSINPRRLRQEIYDDIESIFKLPGAVPGITENVHLTLTKNHQKEEDELLDLAFNRTTIRQED